MGSQNSQSEPVSICSLSGLPYVLDNSIAIATGATDEGGTLSSPPPKFGHTMVEHFGLDPEYINLNAGSCQRNKIVTVFSHLLVQGSYGSPPKYVLEACAKQGQEIETNPDKFMRFTYTSLLRKARERVASLIGADVDECVLVTNATLGVNIVLRNLQWNKEDIIVYSEETSQLRVCPSC